MLWRMCANLNIILLLSGLVAPDCFEKAEDVLRRPLNTGTYSWLQELPCTSHAQAPNLQRNKPDTM